MTRYTAKEMRELAEMIDHGGAFALTDPSIVESNVAMLRQAADDMEREEDRDMKYEYAVRYKNGELSCLRHTEPFRDEDVAAADCICVRRAVGEWEEVTSEGRTM